MRKWIALMLSLLLLLSFAGCSGTDETEKTEVIVFAAASLEATLTQIAEEYRAVAPDVALTFTFDSSGTLRTQIKEGAVCDLFISAGQKQMNQLDIVADSAVNTDGTDQVKSETRVNLVENKVVLAVPDDNPSGITCYEDLTSDKLTLLCLGNEDVPVGAYSLDILKNLNIEVSALEQAGKITYGSNVTEVAMQVKQATVDCGIIYATDAFTYELLVVDEATPALCRQVIYPAALMKCGNEASADAAQAFLDYLRTDTVAVGILEGVGFTVLP